MRIFSAESIFAKIRFWPFSDLGKNDFEKKRIFSQRPVGHDLAGLLRADLEAMLAWLPWGQRGDRPPDLGRKAGRLRLLTTYRPRDAIDLYIGKTV